MNAAEWFSGLPRNCTAPTDGVVNLWKVEKDKCDQPVHWSGRAGTGSAKVLQSYHIGGMRSLNAKHVLQCRMTEGNLPHCNSCSDVRTYDTYVPKGLDTLAEALLAGFPCQGVNNAGVQNGLADSRSGLLHEIWALQEPCTAPFRRSR